MAKEQKSLFDPVVPLKERHPSFELMRTHPTSACARGMFEAIFAEYADMDGNFIEQFQTNGFDPRFFEIYLFAYLTRSGYMLDRSHKAPDFLASRHGVHVAIEATTSNPSKSGALSDAKPISKLTREELIEYQLNEMSIRMGNPLLAKLRKQYWTLPHCAGKPFVLAIEAFHDDESLILSANGLMHFLYGSFTDAAWGDDAALEIATIAIQKHRAGGKEVSTNFFDRPEAENISAVLFTNSGTHSKFSRMGYQHGIATKELEFMRIGKCMTFHRDAMDPTFFSYRLSEPPIIETWGQGISVMHNPNSKVPLPREFFVDAAQVYVEDGKVTTDFHGWHPISSKTMSFYYYGAKEEIAKITPQFPPVFEIIPIPKQEFHAITSEKTSSSSLGEEYGWYADATTSFLGIVLKHPGGKWGFRILARNEYFRFVVIAGDDGDKMREIALEGLVNTMTGLLRSPQRIFPGGVLPAEA